MPFPIEERHINEAEQAIGRIFPSWLRSKMMDENRGELTVVDDCWNVYPFWNKANKEVQTRTADDILRNTKSALEWDSFPQDAVAIAENGTGDLLILLPENDAYFAESVFHWDHQTGNITEVQVQ